MALSPLPRSVWLVALIIASLGANAASAGGPSWIFAPGAYTHDPATGARVAQYQRVQPIEDLPDTRLVTSRYRRIRTSLRGADGSVDSTYEVQSFSDGRGGLDAEWERFHDAWRQSLLTGSYYYQNQPAPLGPAYGYPDGAYGAPGGGYRPYQPRGGYGPAPGYGRGPRSGRGGR